MKRAIITLKKITYLALIAAFILPVTVIAQSKKDKQATIKNLVAAQKLPALFRPGLFCAD